MGNKRCEFRGGGLEWKCLNCSRYNIQGQVPVIERTLGLQWLQRNKLQDVWGKKKNQQRKRIKFKAWVYGNLIYNKDSITKQGGIKLFRV